MNTAGKKYISWVVSTLILALLSGYRCARKYCGPAVVEEGDPSDYPLPRDERLGTVHDFLTKSE